MCLREHFIKSDMKCKLPYVYIVSLRKFSLIVFDCFFFDSFFFRSLFWRVKQKASLEGSFKKKITEMTNGI